MTNCRIAGDLPSALSDTLKPGQGPGSRENANLRTPLGVGVVWGSGGATNYGRGRRILVPTKTSEFKNRLLKGGTSLSWDRMGTHVEDTRVVKGLFRFMWVAVILSSALSGTLKPGPEFKGIGGSLSLDRSGSHVDVTREVNDLLWLMRVAVTWYHAGIGSWGGGSEQ